MSGGWGRGRPTATIVLVALVPVAMQVPGLGALALVTVVCAALIAYEALRYPYARSWIRSHRGAFTMAEASQIAGRRGRSPGAESTSTDPSSVSRRKGQRACTGDLIADAILVYAVYTLAQ